MDRLFRRYADPFLFIDPYFRAGRFAEWVQSFIRAENHEAEERQDELLWQFWLHRYQGSETFGRWKQSINAKPAEPEKPEEAAPADMEDHLEIAFKTLRKIEASRKAVSK